MSDTKHLLSRITVNSVGKPTIRGMRITVEHILRALSGNVSEQELLEEYPEFEKEDFQAVFASATGLVEEEQVFPVDVLRKTPADCITSESLSGEKNHGTYAALIPYFRKYLFILKHLLFEFSSLKLRDPQHFLDRRQPA